MSESLVALRAWYQANKTSPEVLLALKHRNAMQPGVAEALKERAPGETEEEKELGFIFALATVAEKLDAHAILLAGIQVDMIPPVTPPQVERETVPTSHVDVSPILFADGHTELGPEPDPNKE